MILTKFQNWILTKICKKLVIQSPLHKRRITEYYQVMYNAAREHFTEDNHYSLETFLAECFGEPLPLYKEALDSHCVLNDLLSDKEGLPILMGLSDSLDKKIQERLNDCG